MKHPYKEFQHLEVWKVVEKAFFDLENNQDLKVNTSKEYVIGYICQQLFESGFIIDKNDLDKHL